jgi:hypothetical protein
MKLKLINFTKSRMGKLISVFSVGLISFAILQVDSFFSEEHSGVSILVSNAYADVVGCSNGGINNGSEGSVGSNSVDISCAGGGGSAGSGSGPAGGGSPDDGCAGCGGSSGCDGSSSSSD